MFFGAQYARLLCRPAGKRIRWSGRPKLEERAGPVGNDHRLRVLATGNAKTLASSADRELACLSQAVETLTVHRASYRPPPTPDKTKVCVLNKPRENSHQFHWPTRGTSV